MNLHLPSVSVVGTIAAVFVEAGDRGVVPAAVVDVLTADVDSKNISY